MVTRRRQAAALQGGGFRRRPGEKDTSIVEVELDELVDEVAVARGIREFVDHDALAAAGARAAAGGGGGGRTDVPARGEVRGETGIFSLDALQSGRGHGDGR